MSAEECFTIIHAAPERERELRAAATAMGAAYGQESVLFAGKEGKAVWIVTNKARGKRVGSVLKTGSFHRGAGEYSARVGNKSLSFTVEGKEIMYWSKSGLAMTLQDRLALDSLRKELETLSDAEFLDRYAEHVSYLEKRFRDTCEDMSKSSAWFPWRNRRPSSAS